MPLLQLILVAVIQGLTEFLPVSSSAHLILLPSLAGMQDQGPLIDVSVHVGTLGAVVLFFRSEVRLALIGTGRVLRGRLDSPEARLALGLAIATVPAVLFGALLVLTGLNDALRSVKVIGWAMLVFGIVLYWADRTGGTDRTDADWTLKHAVIMGLWQAVALIPGTSRSGITITGARLLGYARTDAARLSMLMSIPVIAASGTLLALDAVGNADAAMFRDGAVAAALALVSALLALSLMMRLLRSISFTPYVIYRIALGVALLVYAYN